MDKRQKRQAALYMLITLIDENEGFIDINSDVVKSSFSDYLQDNRRKTKFINQ